jgi:hypothetical protein
MSTVSRRVRRTVPSCAASVVVVGLNAGGGGWQGKARGPRGTCFVRRSGPRHVLLLDRCCARRAPKAPTPALCLLALVPFLCRSWLHKTDLSPGRPRRAMTRRATIGLTCVRCRGLRAPLRTRWGGAAMADARDWIDAGPNAGPDLTSRSRVATARSGAAGRWVLSGTRSTRRDSVTVSMFYLHHDVCPARPQESRC